MGSGTGCEGALGGRGGRYPGAEMAIWPVGDGKLCECTEEDGSIAGLDAAEVDCVDRDSIVASVLDPGEVSEPTVDSLWTATEVSGLGTDGKVVTAGVGVVIPGVLVGVDKAHCLESATAAAWCRGELTGGNGVVGAVRTL